MINPFKERLRAGQTVVGLLVTIPSAPFVQMVARTGFDWVMIDMEHGPIGLAEVQGMIAATQGTDCVPIVRAPKIDPTPVKPILDAGAFGVVFPMVKTAAEARLAVQCMRYPPAGVRGIAPIMASVRWGVSMPEYLEIANDRLATILLIEDIAAVRNIQQILKVPGIDVAHIAPFDLSASLGLPGQLEHRKVTDAIRRAEDAILDSGIPLGGLGRTPDHANALIERGYRCLVMTHDLGLIEAAAQTLLGPLNRDTKRPGKKRKTPTKRKAGKAPARKR